MAAEDLAAARQALGAVLAARRMAAGLTQARLAQAIGYARVTVATAESGHRRPAAEFWARCDDVLGTAGELTRAHRRLSRTRASGGARPALPAVLDPVGRTLLHAARESSADALLRTGDLEPGTVPLLAGRVRSVARAYESTPPYAAFLDARGARDLALEAVRMDSGRPSPSGDETRPVRWPRSIAACSSLPPVARRLDCATSPPVRTRSVVTPTPWPRRWPRRTETWRSVPARTTSCRTRCAGSSGSTSGAPRRAPVPPGCRRVTDGAPRAQSGGPFTPTGRRPGRSPPVPVLTSRRRYSSKGSWVGPPSRWIRSWPRASGRAASP